MIRNHKEIIGKFAGPGAQGVSDHQQLVNFPFLFPFLVKLFKPMYFLGQLVNLGLLSVSESVYCLSILDNCVCLCGVIRPGIPPHKSAGPLFFCVCFLATQKNNNKFKILRFCVDCWYTFGHLFGECEIVQMMIPCTQKHYFGGSEGSKF